MTAGGAHDAPPAARSGPSPCRYGHRTQRRQPGHIAL